MDWMTGFGAERKLVLEIGGFWFCPSAAIRSGVGDRPSRVQAVL
jgi:hypothetical protein